MGLIERDTELAVLESLVLRLGQDGGGSAVVLGSAGLGKTALLDALADRARLEGFRVARTVAGELEGQVPFGVARRLLDRAVRGLSASELAALGSGPARLALLHLWGLGSGGGGSGVVPPAQGDMLHSLRWLVVELTAVRGLLLVVDDAQWADADSLLFVRSLRDLAAETLLVVVVAARDGSLDRAPELAGLVADRDAVVLRLEPLSESGISTLLGDVWGQTALDVASVVAEVTGGNPFLAIALARALAVAQEGPLNAESIRAAVPDSVTDLVTAQLAALPSAERALAAALAVLDATDLTLAAQLAGLDPAIATGAADRLRRTGLFADGPGLSFRHALLRSAAAAMLGPERRDQLHREAARLFAARSNAEAEATAAAHLLVSSGCGDDWAVQRLREAAATANALGAPRSAAALLQRAVAEPPSAADLPGLLGDLGTAQARTFDPACFGNLARAAALASDPVERAKHALALASAYSYGGRHARAAEMLAETLEVVREPLVGSAPDLELTLEAAWSSAALLVPALVGEARDRLRRRPHLTGATQGERLLLIQQLTVAAGTNRPAAEIRNYADRVIGDWASSDQHPESGDWVWPRLFLAAIGEYDRVRALTDAGLASAVERGSIAGLVTASFARAFTELHAGALPDAEAYYRRMLTPDETSHGADRGLLVETLGIGGLAQSLALQGRIPEAVLVLERLPEQLPDEAPVNGAAMLWVGRSVVRRSLGDHLGALAAAQRVERLGADLGIYSPIWAAWRILAIEPLRVLGRMDQARAMAADHLALCRAGDVGHLVGEALCVSATVAPDAGEAVTTAREGVALLRQSGSRLRLGSGLLTLGSLLRRSGARGEAREPLRDAVDELTDCGAISIAKFARAELAATGGYLSRAEQRRLTPSERRVAEMARAGMSNPEIAASLHVSRKTVETHLSAVYRKLDITGREGIEDRLGT